jgi:hypothetical protein
MDIMSSRDRMRIESRQDEPEVLLWGTIHLEQTSVANITNARTHSIPMSIDQDHALIGFSDNFVMTFASLGTVMAPQTNMSVVLAKS